MEIKHRYVLFVFFTLLHELVGVDRPSRAQHALNNSGENRHGRVLPAADGRRRQNIQRGQHNAHRGQHRRDELVRHRRAGFQAVPHENQRRNQYQQFRLDVVHVIDVHLFCPFQMKNRYKKMPKLNLSSTFQSVQVQFKFQIVLKRTENARVRSNRALHFSKLFSVQIV
nr:MAG TPA: hypothetical protein [Caudoviricetes sp.]